MGQALTEFEDMGLQLLPGFSADQNVQMEAFESVTDHIVDPVHHVVVADLVLLKVLQK